MTDDRLTPPSRRWGETPHFKSFGTDGLTQTDRPSSVPGSRPRTLWRPPERPPLIAPLQSEHASSVSLPEEAGRILSGGPQSWRGTPALFPQPPRGPPAPSRPGELSFPGARARPVLPRPGTTTPRIARGSGTTLPSVPCGKGKPPSPGHRWARQLLRCGSGGRRFAGYSRRDWIFAKALFLLLQKLGVGVPEPSACCVPRL